MSMDLKLSWHRIQNYVSSGSSKSPFTSRMPILRDTVLATSNALLAALPAASRRRVLANAQFASLKPGEVVFAPDTKVPTSDDGENSVPLESWR
jgi:hypothetical protein